MWKQCAAIAGMLWLSVAMLGAGAETQPERPKGVPKEWVEVKADRAFSFWAPADLKEEKVQGIDSFVGSYTNAAMTMKFDYGLFSNPMDDPRYKREAIELDGRKAFLVTSEGVVGLYVPDVREAKDVKGSAVRLQVSIKCTKDSAGDAEAMLRSIRFVASEVMRRR